MFWVGQLGKCDIWTLQKTGNNIQQGIFKSFLKLRILSKNFAIFPYNSYLNIIHVLFNYIYMWLQIHFKNLIYTDILSMYVYIIYNA